MSTPAITRYPIPETRLPFVNTVITETAFAGEPALVSSVWVGAGGGRIYFWNPDTGIKAERKLPEGIPGAYMLKQGPDGRLYLGCGNGDLVRYDPAADAFERLVEGELHAITWGGCVTDRLVVWAASPGEAAVYDWREDKLLKVFRPLDSMTPHALYGRIFVETPDGKILGILAIPESRFVLIDPDTLEAESFSPAALGPALHLYDLAFFTPEVFGLTAKGSLYLFRYPSLELEARIDLPQDADRLRGQWSDKHKAFFGVGHEGDHLYRWDLGASNFELLEQNWTGQIVGATGLWHDGGFCALTIGGTVLRFHPETGTTDRLDLDAWGTLPAHALCVSPEAGMICGAPFINQRFWTMDLESGEGQDQGQAAAGGGQINQVVWDPLTRRFMLSSYTTCSVVAYDPTRPSRWPENPCLLATAEDHGQMRPTALVHDGAHLWMTSTSKYGTLGGALSRIDPRTGGIDVWRHIVPDQSMVALVADPARKRVYCSSNVHADCSSAPPTADTARLVAFDTETLSVVRSDAVEDGLTALAVLALLETGEVLVSGNGALYAWNPESGGVRKLGKAPRRIRGAISWRPEHGVLIVGNGGLLRLDLKGDRFTLEALVNEQHAAYPQIAAGKLWYASPTDICSFDLQSLS